MASKSTYQDILNCHNSLQAFWFPWFWRRTETAQLRKCIARIVWRSNPSFIAKFKLTIKLLVWPIIAAFALLTAWAESSSSSFILSYRSRTRQLWELFVFSYWYGFTPSDYYEVRIYMMNMREDMPYFISHNDTDILAIHTGGDRAERLNCKTRFNTICQSANLPIIVDIADEVAGGALPLPKNDIFLKPSNGYLGRGVERWNYDSATSQWSDKANRFDETAMRHYIARLQADKPYVVQDAMENHPDIAQLSAGGLITFRIHTIHTGKGEASVLGAYMTCPTNNAVTNHEIYGGMLANIDLKSAVIGPGYSEISDISRHDVHPTTGAQFAGVKLPCLQEMLQIAIKTHAHFPDLFSVGWDIAYTKEGIRILEGNSLWGMEVGLFLGKTAYVPGYLDLLKNK